MTRLLAIALVLAACKSDPPQTSAPPPPVPTPQPPPAAPISRDALLAGSLPVGPETELINAQCRICHSLDYLTQQRLGEAAWKKTIEKMRKFGANLSDADITTLVSFAARYWNPDLPGRTWTPVPPPAGALPVAK